MNSQVYIKKDGSNAELPEITDNEATFTMKKDESAEISCLPTGWTYTVTETDPGINYKSSFQIDDGNKTDSNRASFTMPAKGYLGIQFTNTSTITPPSTGIKANHSGFSLFTLIPVSFVLILVISCYRK